jgi:hypothetical protein
MRSKRSMAAHVAALIVVLGSGLSACSGSSTDKTATALEVARMAMPEDAYGATLRVIVDQMLQMLASQQGQAPPAGMAEKISAAIMEAMPRDDLMKASADIYAARFTVQELDQLRAFYATDAGTKLAKQMPEITRDISAFTTSAVQRNLPAALKRQGIEP